MTIFTEQHPGVEQKVPPETSGFTFNHTMLRIKEPQRSLAFYSRVFGMRVLRKLDFPEMQFTLYFLARVDVDETVPEDVGERTMWTFSRRGVLELTHNWGTEDQADFAYHDGNAEPQGFGHICFSVPDLATAIHWLESNEVTFVKRPEEGKMKNVAFVKDPDGYWIEIVEAALMSQMGR
ncbi:lactoylglutathione lyase [Modicisalibacter ilicicola DSM 19980]|uniref:Lactoylglutathione lyase n=1 Tax=Modicisalibacter ilicicola DSM 19980 TaxID=1121942 RepID=A0A1M5EK97_9GAMM|nr:lactoylglutathione lyase [Halomonas ilicicola]SHF79472.1 lactoylglutathione lyase [Halomonas ilicicola DSM 19980]